jgi:C1A family cysteine protease
VSGYRWAVSVDGILNHVLTTGPVVMGTDWYYGMLDTDRKGFVEPTGSSVGGHAWLIVGANRSKGFQAHNSWGSSWGTAKGRFWITFQHMEPLLDNWGEAAVAVENKSV